MWLEQTQKKQCDGVKMFDPRTGNVALDANALDYDGVRNLQIDRLLALHEEEKVSLVLPGSVRAETMNANTPRKVRELMGDQIYTISGVRTPDEHRVLRQIQELMRGNADPGKHAADGEHVFEAQKYCRFFVTKDKRILNKREAIGKLIGDTLAIVTVEELLAMYDATAK